MAAVIVEPIFAKSVAAVVSISGVAITNDISLPRSGQPGVARRGKELCDYPGDLPCGANLRDPNSNDPLLTLSSKGQNPKLYANELSTVHPRFPSTRANGQTSTVLAPRRYCRSSSRSRPGARTPLPSRDPAGEDKEWSAMWMSGHTPSSTSSWSCRRAV
ncbi:hypothetical protein FRD67_00970 [Mycobacterium tuberculosis]|nr:hypothetical protein FRD56_00970 [Mycobacterium tuberculosis]TWS90991.1 hypothetical protein FRD74_00720 [Mycobacterium tuberculosis]TWT00798.1 hypothetical protein FRD67_00970 [Mycobacterium tuberculosis]